MQQIDEARLESDLEYRFGYLADFIGFSDQDVAAIQEAGPYLAPLLPALIERTYDKLLSFDATARHFVPRQHGFDGAVPQSVEELSRNHDQIRFRMNHLQRYFLNLFGRAYDGKMIAYMDMAAKIHTTQAGNKDIQVPLVQMNALLGLLSDFLLETIGNLGLDPAEVLRICRAFNKVLWLQNDFIARNYQDLPPSDTSDVEEPKFDEGTLDAT